MHLTTPRLLVLALAITTALAACKKSEDAPVAATADAPAARALTLDESKLPTATRFAIGDLDANTPACVDFDGHINSK